MDLRAKKILVTRAVSQNVRLVELLRAKGATPVIYPCIEILPQSFKIPDKDYDCLVLTSRNAAKAIEPYLRPQWQIKTVGSETSSKDLADFFATQRPLRILLPQGNLADDSLKKALEQNGHTVTKIIVYETHPAKPQFDLESQLPLIDAITFTSPSCVHHFPKELEFQGPVHCLGRSTYEAALERGFGRVYCAQQNRLEDLIQSLESAIQNA